MSLSICPFYCRESRAGDGGDEETVLDSFGFLDDEDSDEDENEDDEDEGVYHQDTTSVSDPASVSRYESQRANDVDNYHGI